MNLRSLIVKNEGQHRVFSFNYLYSLFSKAIWLVFTSHPISRYFVLKKVKSKVITSWKFGRKTSSLLTRRLCLFIIHFFVLQIFCTRFLENDSSDFLQTFRANASSSECLYRRNNFTKFTSGRNLSSFSDFKK